MLEDSLLDFLVDLALVFVLLLVRLELGAVLQDLEVVGSDGGLGGVVSVGGWV